MTDPAGPSSEDPTSRPAEGLDAGAAERPADRPDLEAQDPAVAGPESHLPVRQFGRHRCRRRAPGLIVAALLVGAGVFLALRGMQQVVARAPATPAPSFVPTPGPTVAPTQAPASIGGPATPTPQPTPMPTASPLILFP